MSESPRLDGPASEPAPAVNHQPDPALSVDLSFGDWLKEVPTVYQLLAAAVAAAVGLLAPERFIPQPLTDFKFIPTIVVVIAFVLTWTLRRELRDHLRAVTVGTFILFLVLVTLNIRYVRPVEYANPQETVLYLIGETIVDPELCGNVPQRIILQCGGDWDALESVWGASLVVVAISYAVTYILFITGLILAIGGSSFRRSRTG